MSENKCVHGMPNPRACVDCMEDGVPLDPPRWRKEGAWFQAKFSGRCRAVKCGQVFGVGEYIQRWDKVDGGSVIDTAYTHTECGL